MTRLVDLDPADFALPPEVLARTQTPVLVVDLARVRANAARMIELVGGARRWRPHVKTTKSPVVWSELVEAGVRHFKCATTREARLLAGLLAKRGVRGADVLVAYPLRGPALGALSETARAHPSVRLSVLCEDPSIAESLPPGLGVFVDVNVGMDRTGIPVGDPEAVLTVARAADANGERLRGLHGYEGHLHDGTPGERRDAAFACYARLVELAERLRGAELPVEELITSGTPGFAAALDHPPLADLAATHGIAHRVSPGTVVFHDARSEEQNGDIGLLPAAVVVTRVVSHPAADIVTCDAGSKSIAAEAGDPCAFVVGRPELDAQGPSEEHLPLRVTRGARPERGEALALVPRHVCPTVNLAEEALFVDGDRIRRVAVPARAHD